MLYMYINMLLDLFLYILNDQLDSIDLRKVNVFFYIIEFSLTSSYNGHAYPPYGRGVF